MPVLLQDRAVLSLFGPDARQFLQGLITSDVENLSPAHPLYAALLTPQGKILFDFLLFEDGESILLDCWRPQREPLLKRLTMYRLRSKVEIAPRDDLAVFADWQNKATGYSDDPRLVALGQRWIADNDMASDTDDYLGHRLALGVPEGGDFGQDKIFALDAGLEELHGVSFDKGCYVGQELTARMKHRGTARKRLLQVESLDGEVLSAGETLSADGRELGEITSSYGSRGFALIRLDRLTEAGNVPIQTGNTPVRVIRQNWLAV